MATIPSTQESIVRQFIDQAAMWRVKYGEGNASGNGSGGDWRYYEADGFAHMEAELLDALLNGDCGDGGNYSRGNRLSRILRRHRRPELDGDGSKWRRYRVIEVAYMKGDEWVPVKVSWTPPTVVLED